MIECGNWSGIWKKPRPQRGIYSTSCMYMCVYIYVEMPFSKRHIIGWNWLWQCNLRGRNVFLNRLKCKSITPICHHLPPTYYSFLYLFLFIFIFYYIFIWIPSLQYNRNIYNHILFMAFNNTTTYCTKQVLKSLSLFQSSPIKLANAFSQLDLLCPNHSYYIKSLDAFFLELNIFVINKLYVKINVRNIYVQKM